MKKVFIFIILILLVGCSNKIEKQGIDMHCNGVKTNIEVKENDILNCKLLGENYEFKITKVSNKDITLEVNDYGLTDTNSLLEKKKIFKINKGSELKLNTQTTDYQESVIFNWK